MPFHKIMSTIDLIWVFALNCMTVGFWIGMTW